MKLDSQEPIFIVGAPRSGTTLLAAMLAAHSRLSCGPETRFFRFLAKADSVQLYDSWPDNAVDFLFSITLMDPIPEHYGISREQIWSYLKERPPGVPAILASLTEQFMDREGKHRWAEKSPENLMHVSEIREHFPGSPIVRIVRDPRDTALSMVRWPNGPQDFLEALLFWRKYEQQSAGFFQDDANCYTLYYENLTRSPETELRQLCDFIGEEYESAMLDTSRSAGNVVTERETWKRLVSKPVDQSRVHTWKRELSREQNRIAEALIGDRLIAYGYERSERFDCVAYVYPSLDTLLGFREPLVSFVDEGIRFWQTDQDEKSHVDIYVGEPDRDKWVSQKKPDRWWDTLRIIKDILKGKFANRRVYWVRDQDITSKLGQCSRVLAFVFQHTAERQLA